VREDAAGDTSRVPAPKGRRRRFGLRDPFVLMMVLCGVCALAWYGQAISSTLRQRQLIRSVERLGGFVNYGEHGSDTGAHGFVCLGIFSDEPSAQCVTEVEFLLGSTADDEVLRQLWRLPNVELLRIESQDDLTGSMAHVAMMPKLKYLDLYNTHISEESFDHLHGMVMLRSLSFGGKSITDDDLRQLSAVPQLEVLTLDNTRVTGHGLAHLRNVTKLRVLLLAFTPLEDEALAHIANLEQLEYLSLTATNVTDDGVGRLVSLNRLKHLELDFTSVTDVVLEHLARMPHLETVCLEGTMVSKDGLDRLRSRSKVEAISGRIGGSN